MEQGRQRESEQGDQHEGQILGTGPAAHLTDSATASQRLSVMPAYLGSVSGWVVGGLLGHYWCRLSFIPPSLFERPERTLDWGFLIVVSTLACNFFTLPLGYRLCAKGCSRWLCNLVVACGPFLGGIIGVLAANGDLGLVGAVVRRFSEQVFLLWGLVLDLYLLFLGFAFLYRHRGSLPKIATFLGALAVLLGGIGGMLSDDWEGLRFVLTQLANPSKLAGAAFTVIAGILAFIAFLLGQRQSRGK